MKKRLVSICVKKAMALALATALITPVALANIGATVAEAVDGPKALMTLDFEKGFKGEEGNGFQVVESEQVLRYTHTDTLREDGGTDYEYHYDKPEYSTGSSASYTTGIMSNQPSSALDGVKGHVLWMQNDASVEEFIKTETPNYKPVTGEISDEAMEEWKVLDESNPPYKAVYDEDGNETEDSLKAKEKATLQKAYTYYPKVKMNNPFAKAEELTGVTVNYWIKLTPEADDAEKAENTVVINFGNDMGLQYEKHDEGAALPPEDPDSTIGYGFANGILQFSADGTVIFTQDDGTAREMNQKNPNYGKIGSYNEDNCFYQEGSETVLTDYCKPDEWHMVTITITNDTIKFYYDGKEDAAEHETQAGEGFGNTTILEWLADENTYAAIGGSNEKMMKAYGQTPNVTDYRLDDLSFYGQILEDDQITALYEAGAAEIAYAQNEDKPLPEATVITFDSADNFSVDFKANNVSGKVDEPVVINDARMGSVLHTFANRATETSAVKLASPYAGKSIKGATVAYWMKSTSTTATVGISFVDEKKPINHSKIQDAYKGTEATSILYGKNDGYAEFSEGSADPNIPRTLDNRFVSKLSDENAANLLAENATDWHLYTLTVTNEGIRYYVDGVLQANEYTDRSPRFFDGYYQRMVDTKDKNLIYGGSNNFGATSLLGFLTYEDTAMYLAYANVHMGATYQTCQEAYFGEVICFEEALDANQVAKLYTQQAEKYPAPEFETGDVDGNSVVDASDALLVLKAAAQIETLSDAQKAVADVEKDGVIDANDALKILKFAAQIISSWD